jgi:hypothetical protein
MEKKCDWSVNVTPCHSWEVRIWKRQYVINMNILMLWYFLKLEMLRTLPCEPYLYYVGMRTMFTQLHTLQCCISFRYHNQIFHGMVKLLFKIMTNFLTKFKLHVREFFGFFISAVEVPMLLVCGAASLGYGCLCDSFIGCGFTFLCKTPCFRVKCAHWFKIYFTAVLSKLWFQVCVTQSTSTSTVKLIKDGKILFYIRTQCVPRCKHSPLRL